MSDVDATSATTLASHDDLTGIPIEQIIPALGMLVVIARLGIIPLP